MQVKFAITLAVDPESQFIGRQAMNTALQELHQLHDVPIDKITFAIAIPVKDIHAVHEWETRIALALRDVPSQVEITVKTTTEQGVERRRRDLKPMDALWTPPTNVDVDPKLRQVALAEAPDGLLPFRRAADAASAVGQNNEEGDEGNEDELDPNR